jgi:Cellulose binding domain/Bacterial Ig domain
MKGAPGAKPGRSRRAAWAAAAGAALLAAGLATGMTAVAAPAATAAACAVQYTVNSSWPAGFSISISITNEGPAITNWTLRYSYTGGQQLAEGWNGTWSQSGETVTVTNAPWNARLAAGATTQVGANFSGSGTAAAPASFSLNGTSCNGDMPIVSITSPPPGVVDTGTTVTLQATAVPNGSGSIVSVTFDALSVIPSPQPGVTTEIGVATASPYTVQWVNVGTGCYSVTATAITATGVTGTSAPLDICAGPNGTPPP